MRTKESGPYWMVGSGVATLAIAILLSSGCASSPKTEPAPRTDLPPLSERGDAYASDIVVLSDDRAQTVSEIIVNVAPALRPEAKLRLQEIDGPALLKDAVLHTLTANRKFDPKSPLVMHVTLTNVRLRSAGLTVWVGSMAGLDQMGAVVSVWKGDELVQRHPVRTRTAAGGLYSQGPAKRFELMSNTLAAEVVGGL
jgi:hypothetical protein